MGTTKDLERKNAVEKLQQLTKGENTCMFCTYGSANELQSRPMTLLKVDDEGNLWFMSDKSSKKNHAISENSAVAIFYLDTGKEKYLSLRGTAKILFDKKIIEELWNPFAKIWFQDGKDDPNISIIKVTPDQAHYWDTKHGKMVEFIKLASAMATGKEFDEGVQGSLEV